jgi:recombinational DNA repair ATPase RecF
MSTPLKALKLSSFRGSSQTFSLGFEKGKSLTIIYGENGSGKTTICDAFEFLASERLGSLEDRGIGRGVEQYWPTAGRSQKDLSVELVTTSGACVGKFAGKKVSITPANARPKIELLRRQQVLRLVEARPADRYEEIKRFIDIANVEAAEESLRQLSKTLKDEADQARRLEGESLQTLQNFFEAAGSPKGLNPLSWAKDKLSSSNDNHEQSIKAIVALRSSFTALQAFPGRSTASAKEIADAQAAAAAAAAAVTEAAAAASADAGELLNLLEAGQAYLHDHPNPAECPLCRSSQKVAGLDADIKARLESFEALKKTQAESTRSDQRRSRANAISAQVTTEYGVARVAYGASIKQHTWPKEVGFPDATPPEDLKALPDWLTSAATVAATWADVEAVWRGETKFVAALRSSVEQYETNLRKRMEIADLAPNVEKAVDHCKQERQAFTDGIVKEIAKEVGRLYEIVHPGEGLDKISLPLDPDKRASIELKADFSGHDAPPQAYFSQSHLDTLGLCVFLALALREAPKDKILILDDVLGSVDEPHVERVIGLLYDASSQFRHTIVTTHYRPWREKYRWGWLKPGQGCQFVELTNWTLANGVRLTNTLPEIDRLKEHLVAENPDLQAICGKAGVILEGALDYLTLKYECSVPRRVGAAYTLGDLLPAINGKLREALTIEILETAVGAVPAVKQTIKLKPIFEELHRIVQTRNAMGAHFKMISFEMLDADALAFGHQVVALMDAITDPDHGWPSSDKSGSYWRNSGDTRRLHPLKKPG